MSFKPTSRNLHLQRGLRRLGIFGPLVGSLIGTLVAACAVEQDAAPPGEAAPRSTTEQGSSSASSASSALAAAPSPGAPGVGDAWFPMLGNGGYEVDHYDLALRYDAGAPDHVLDGTATIIAHATQALSRFDLDFAGDSFGAVTVNGRPAAAVQDGAELVITPARPLRRGEPFVVAVHHFVARAAQTDPDDFLGAPFFSTPDGSAWVNQPGQAHQTFPCNDHPSDKATFTFRLDVPAGMIGVAAGELLGQHTANGRTVLSYVQLQPMATELTQVAVGHFTVTSRGVHRGVRVRDVTPTRLTATLAPQLAVELDQLTWLEQLLGPYPFGTYGALVVDVPLGFLLETQTLSLYPAFLFDDAPENYRPAMVHELAHQWFGNSVAQAKWSEVWQSEGHATWYELASRFAPGSADFAALIQDIYSLSDLLRFVHGPVAAPRGDGLFDLFNANVYYGGAMVLYALRQEVGDATFQRIERAWATRYRGRSPSTQDFIALASEIARRDLSAFLGAWLYGETTPAMPGHPDWTVMPPPAPPLGAGLVDDLEARRAASRDVLAGVKMFAEHRRR